MFQPGLKIGQIVSNMDIVKIFKCANMGGMRRSKKNNTLVLIADNTKKLYKNKWINGVLHYIGMGKIGDQDINRSQNATLAKSNDIDIYIYIYSR